MYGYLKYDFKEKKNQTNSIYKCYYCGLCCALKKNYGWLSTVFLSNDVVFLSMILSSGSQRMNYSKPKCCLWKRCSKISIEYKNTYWKRMAAFTLALVNAKAYDDVLDNNTMFSKLRYGLVKIITKRAKSENPAMFEYMKGSMISLSRAEKMGIGIAEQSEMFSWAILSSITMFVEKNLAPTALALISAILKWLCFIDAVDDYESDVKKNIYNPFNWCARADTNSISESWNVFFSKNWSEVLLFYSDIFVQIQNAMQNIPNNQTVEKEIICQMVYKNMPQKITNIMKGSKK